MVIRGSSCDVSKSRLSFHTDDKMTLTSWVLDQSLQTKTQAVVFPRPGSGTKPSTVLSRFVKNTPVHVVCECDLLASSFIRSVIFPVHLWSHYKSPPTSLHQQLCDVRVEKRCFTVASHSPPDRLLDVGSGLNLVVRLCLGLRSAVSKSY